MTGIAIVGTGFGYRIQLPALRAAGFDVLAFVGRDPVKTARRAERRGVPHACVSLTEALAIPGVDAIAVATPPVTHGPLVLEAVAGGRHVLCEKPFAMDVAEARTMYEAAVRAGVVHLVGHEFRFSAVQATMQRVIASGEIGEPRLVAISSFSPIVASQETTMMPGWFFDPSSGGGWLRACGSHSIDRIRTWLGDITAVSASVSTRTVAGGVADDSYSLHFSATSGATGTLTESGASWLPESIGSTVVVGTDGIVTISGSDVVVATATGRRVVEPAPDVGPEPAAGDSDDYLTRLSSLELTPYSRLAGVFMSAINGTEPTTDILPATFADGLAEMAVIDAVQRSASDGGSLQRVESNATNP